VGRGSSEGWWSRSFFHVERIFSFLDEARGWPDLRNSGRREKDIDRVKPLFGWNELAAATRDRI
jgi:hypothetical protein